MPRRRINPLTSFGVPLVGGGIIHPVAEYQWFVDKNWTKGFGDGREQDHPLENLQDAIDNCVANRGDVIYVGAGGAEVTETVSFNKAGISVIAWQHGLYRRSQGEYFSIYAASTFTDGPVATITQPCYIDGLAFVSRDTGATFYDGAAMLIGGLATALPFGVHINNCRFPKWGLDNRIGIAIEGTSDCAITNCGFEGVTADFESGIYVQGATQNLYVGYNHFRDCDYAITHGAFAGGGPHCIYEGNIVEGADSKFLDSGANTATGAIVGNYFNTAPGASTFDRTVAQLAVQGLTCSGNHYANEDEGPV